MQTENTENRQDSVKEEKRSLKQKKDRFSWWQALLFIGLSLVVSLTAGYYISAKYLWKDTDQSQIEKNLKYYTEQVDLKPNDPNNRVQLGFTYFLKKDYDEAIKQYNTAINLDKNDYNAYLNLAIVYDRENRANDALEMAAKAVKLSPQDYKAYLLEGRSYRKLKMYKEATSSLSDASRFMAGNVDIVYEIGLVAEAQGKKKEAEQIFKEALSYDPLYKPAQKSLESLTSKETNKK